MAAWFRKGVGITEAASAVSAWADQSGNGRNLVQATGANQPDVQADGTILFNGTSDFLKTAPFTLSQPCSIYLRVKQVSWTLNDYWMDGNANDSGAIYVAGSSPQFYAYAGAPVGPNGNLPVGTWGSVCVVFNGASSVTHVDGSTAVTGNAGAANMGGLTIGASGGGAAWSNIQIAEIIPYSGADDAARRAQVFAYMATVGP